MTHLARALEHRTQHIDRFFPVSQIANEWLQKAFSITGYVIPPPLALTHFHDQPAERPEPGP